METGEERRSARVYQPKRLDRRTLLSLRSRSGEPTLAGRGEFLQGEGPALGRMENEMFRSGKDEEELGWTN